MPATKELRRRIKSIRNTSKITKAMELVSAAKMRRAQEQALGGRNYSEIINQVLRNISTRINPELHPLLTREENSKTGVLLITSNRGLCGALNANLFKKALDIHGEVSFIAVGKKGEVFISKIAKPMLADFLLLEKPTVEQARIISKFLIKEYLEANLNKIYVLYSHFESTLKQEAKMRQLLPISDTTTLETIKHGQDQGQLEYKFEPTADEVFETILPHYIEMEIYQVLTEAAASEHSARMVAMKNASDNAAELVDDLSLIYNQLRQESITNEILDISTAAVALN